MMGLIKSWFRGRKGEAKSQDSNRSRNSSSSADKGEHQGETRAPPATHHRPPSTVTTRRSLKSTTTLQKAKRLIQRQKWRRKRIKSKARQQESSSSHSFEVRFQANLNDSWHEQPLVSFQPTPDAPVYRFTRILDPEEMADEPDSLSMEMPSETSSASSSVSPIRVSFQPVEDSPWREQPMIRFNATPDAPLHRSTRELHSQEVEVDQDASMEDVSVRFESSADPSPPNTTTGPILGDPLGETSTGHIAWRSAHFQYPLPRISTTRSSPPPRTRLRTRATDPHPASSLTMERTLPNLPVTATPTSEVGTLAISLQELHQSILQNTLPAERIPSVPSIGQEPRALNLSPEADHTFPQAPLMEDPPMDYSFSLPATDEEASASRSGGGRDDEYFVLPSKKKSLGAVSMGADVGMSFGGALRINMTGNVLESPSFSDESSCEDDEHGLEEDNTVLNPQPEVIHRITMTGSILEVSTSSEEEEEEATIKENRQLAIISRQEPPTTELPSQTPALITPTSSRSLFSSNMGCVSTSFNEGPPFSESFGPKISTSDDDLRTRIASVTPTHEDMEPFSFNDVVRVKPTSLAAGDSEVIMLDEPSNVIRDDSLQIAETSHRSSTPVASASRAGVLQQRTGSLHVHHHSRHHHQEPSDRSDGDFSISSMSEASLQRSHNPQTVRGFFHKIGKWKTGYRGGGGSTSATTGTSMSPELTRMDEDREMFC